LFEFTLVSKLARTLNLGDMIRSSSMSKKTLAFFYVMTGMGFGSVMTHSLFFDQSPDAKQAAREVKMPLEKP
jgi:hypothetical protein